MEETLEAKLRNELSPIYCLCDLINVINDGNYKEEQLNEILELIKNSSILIKDKQKDLNNVLEAMEANSTNNVDLFRKSFNDARKLDENDVYLYENFDVYAKYR